MVISTLTELSDRVSIDGINICNLLFGIRQFEIGNQLKDSLNEIKTNITEASSAENRAEFIQKLYAASNECNECIYWLDIVRLGVILEPKDLAELYNTCYSILRLLKYNIETTNGNLE